MEGIINGGRKSNRVEKTTIHNRKIQSRTIVSQTIDLGFYADDCFFFFLPWYNTTLLPMLPILVAFIYISSKKKKIFVVCHFQSLWITLKA